MAADMDPSFDFDLGHFNGSGDFAWDDNAAFTAINASGFASSTQTISPKDVFNDNLGSAPPSTAFTNLTSPDINESPFSAYETSPLFGAGDITSDPQWPTLFPDAANNDTSAQEMTRNISNLSTDQSSSSGASPLVTLESSRRKSSAQSPLGVPMARHSSTSGVNRRRRKGPLPPITYDTNDKVALKRARNTMAARESRQRKLDHVSALEARIAELEQKELEMKEALINCGYNGPLLDE